MVEDAKQAVYVEKIEKRVGSGIWVTATNGGPGGASVTYNVLEALAPTIGERLVVTIERSTNDA
jgi:hypothetical protein